ncbi:hypothetical protein NQ318_015513 [Aromia moschata]|uniref:Uncharacterized protein n=1 Tax=Aromia moschata TaxID=1265417 RepID=A0AAV8XRA7_9CUCU|nr:hypothetical protein NQ318_015513 [Aromia moschata]
MDRQKWTDLVACQISGLTPCDFYLWGHMKQLVYSEPVNSIEELTARTAVAAETIREYQLYLVEFGLPRT